MNIKRISTGPGRWLALTLLTAVGAGCATREPLPELVAARQEVTATAQNAAAAEAGAVRLQEARAALAAAEGAFNDRKDDEVVREYAYTASRNAQIAREQGAEAEGRKAVESAEAERNRVVLQARTEEADTARDAARENKQAAESARDEADLLREQMAELQAKQTERGMVLTLSDVLFDTNQSVVKPGALADLDRIGRFLASNDGVRIIVEGHTDNQGSDSYNLDLSSRRAEAVRNIILRSGVASERVRAAGMGEGYPVAANDNAAGRQQNRRVEVIFSDQGGAFTPGGERSVPTPEVL